MYNIHLKSPNSTYSHALFKDDFVSIAQAVIIIFTVPQILMDVSKLN